MNLNELRRATSEAVTCDDSTEQWLFLASAKYQYLIAIATEEPHDRRRLERAICDASEV